MAQKRITDLAIAAALTGDEWLEFAQLSDTVTITATTISAAAADNSFNDSANGFVAAGFAVNDRVNVIGFTGDVANNIFVGLVTAVTAGKITIGGTDGDVIVDDAAGESVTITKWVSRRATAQEIADLAGGGGGGGTAWQIAFRPIDNQPPSANQATLDTRNRRPVLEFDTATQETAIFASVLPSGYGGGGITVTAIWAADTATTGTIGWDVAVERIDASSLDIDADSFGTAFAIAPVNVPATSGQVIYSSVNIANGADMDNLAAGEMFRIRLRRDVANDTAAGDAQLLALVIKEQ